MDKILYPQPVNLEEYKPDISDPKVFYGLPSEVKYCRKCVISNQRPNSAVVSKNRITGCQFHPEKSGESGLKILREFAFCEI